MIQRPGLFWDMARNMDNIEINQKQAAAKIISKGKGTHNLKQSKLGPMTSLVWWWAVTS